MRSFATFIVAFGAAAVSALPQPGDVVAPSYGVQAGAEYHPVEPQAATYGVDHPVEGEYHDDSAHAVAYNGETAQDADCDDNKSAVVYGDANAGNGAYVGAKPVPASYFQHGGQHNPSAGKPYDAGKPDDAGNPYDGGEPGDNGPYPPGGLPPTDPTNPPADPNDPSQTPALPASGGDNDGGSTCARNTTAACCTTSHNTGGFLGNVLGGSCLIPNLISISSTCNGNNVYCCPVNQSGFINIALTCIPISA